MSAQNVKETMVKAKTVVAVLTVVMAALGACGSIPIQTGTLVGNTQLCTGYATRYPHTISIESHGRFVTSQRVVFPARKYQFALSPGSYVVRESIKGSILDTHTVRVAKGHTARVPTVLCG